MWSSLSLVSALALVSAMAQAASPAVSVRVGDPDFYGRIEWGQPQRPAVIVDEPVLIHRTRYDDAPVYLRVPPEHRRAWGRHCGYYRACARPVYFVQERWYRDTYWPQRGRWEKHGRWRHHHHDRRGHPRWERDD
ncbi:hypothetical protein [Chitinibacter tainanensis]|uniref:hypothetical protein n=1 Tax=Chitinibacter tainanensis TaxID=230667 RepID=UPI002357FF22|nr:hypothetical protein [Chitinibacter tainanensis]